MPTYIFRLVADSSVRLSETPYIENTLFPFTLTLQGQFVVTVLDNTVILGEINIPKGLMVQAQVDADDITSAIGHAEGVANYVLSMLSCVCNASICQPLPLWGYDATPDVTSRDVVIFAYEHRCKMKTRAFQKSIWSAVLEAKFNGFMAREDVAGDLKKRVQRAVICFRRGLADTEDALDEFLVHWSTLETLDNVYRIVFTHEIAHYPKTCGNCKSEFRHCPVCGDEGVFRSTQRHTGIEAIFEHLGQPAKYNQLKRLRNGISHGYMSLAECEEKAGQDIDLVRKAVLAMILRIIGLPSDSEAQILAAKGIKGKAIPTFRVYGKGTFEPGDATCFDTHPGFAAECTNLGISKHEKVIVLNPTWIFRHATVPMTDIVAELWADENLGLVVTDDISFLQDGSEPQSEAAG